MNEFLANLLELLSEEELIRFGRRAEMAGKLSLATMLKTEQLERERLEQIELRQKPDFTRFPEPRK